MIMMIVMIIVMMRVNIPLGDSDEYRITNKNIESVKIVSALKASA